MKNDPQIGQMKERRPHAKIAKNAKKTQKNYLLAFFAPLAIFA